MGQRERIPERDFKKATRSFRLRVLGFCLLQDRDIGIGVFRQCEEILLGGAAFGGVALQPIVAGEVSTIAL